MSALTTLIQHKIRFANAIMQEMENKRYKNKKIRNKTIPIADDMTVHVGNTRKLP